MAYQVEMTPQAKADAYFAFERIRALSPTRAEKWLKGLFAAVLSLDEMPTRCSLIPEANDIQREARQLLYGKRTGTYRIIFDIDGEAETTRVRVLRIWHGSRADLRAEDIEDELP